MCASVETPAPDQAGQRRFVRFRVTKRVNKKKDRGRKEKHSEELEGGREGREERHALEKLA